MTNPLPESAVELAARLAVQATVGPDLTRLDHEEYAEAIIRAALPAIREAVGKEYAPVVTALETFMEWWDTEAAGPQWTTPERRDCPEGEVVWRKWWQNQLRLAALAPELGRTALAALTEQENRNG